MTEATPATSTTAKPKATKKAKPTSTQHRGPTEAMIKFAELVAAGMDKTNAYRQAYPRAKGKPEHHQAKACHLAKHKNVAPLIVELMVKARDKAAAQISYGLKEAMEEANAAFQMAQSKGLPTAMTGAVFLKSRLLGLLAEERKNDRTPLSELTDEQLRTQIGEAAKQAGYELAEKLAQEAVATASASSSSTPAPAPAAKPLPLPKVAAPTEFKLG